VEGAKILAGTGGSGLQELHVAIPAGVGYQQATVRVSW